MTLLTGTIESFTQTKTEIASPIVENKRNEPLSEVEKLKELFEDYDITLKGNKTSLNGYISCNNIFTVYISPTANCQTCSIAGFQQIFNYPNKVNSYLLNIYEYTKKKLIIIDIRQDYLCYFDEQIDKDMVMSKSLYDSTNGSKMALIMLNISKLVPPTTIG